ncbi:MAG: adenosine deaminase, partial [Streptosporangiaceae bacterium]
MARPLALLPKAHLHLHFTGSMRHSTLVELAGRRGIHLPDALVSQWPPRLSVTDERGWFRFQRLYDIARSVVATPDDVRRLLAEAAQDERADGSGWLEIQVDPSGYAGRLGGLTPTLELVLKAAAQASAATGVGIGVIVAANRTKHPLEARTLARLAAGYAGHGVTGFGLSNDERRGAAADFAPAFRIARRAGLAAVPHGGELCGPASVRACLDELHADRIGHGVAAASDPGLLARLSAAGTTLEVCPASNVALGVAARPADVPLR